MLSYASRWLTYLTAILYAILGIALFFLSERLAPVFAWKVTPFMTATMGGWCIGNAFSAFISARRWDWKLIYPALIYLWIFGVAELLVLIVFRDKLTLQHPIAWLYFITICVNALTAIVGVYDLLRLKPRSESFGPQAKGYHYVLIGGFVVIVIGLAIYGLYAQIGDVGTNGGVFPEVMSLFTLRAFAAFYFSLSVSAAIGLRERNLSTLLNYGFSSYLLVVAITAAIFVYLHLFDFANHPGQFIYVGAYFLVGIPLTITLLREGTGLRPA